MGPGRRGSTPPAGCPGRHGSPATEAVTWRRPGGCGRWCGRRRRRRSGRSGPTGCRRRAPITGSGPSASPPWARRPRCEPGCAPRAPWRRRWATVLQQLAQPRRVADVGLAAGQDLHVPGVDQQQLEPALLQHIPDRLPVLPGRLHHHLGDPLVAEPVAQRRKASAERLVGADLLAAPAADGASGHAGAGDDLVLTHVKPSAALVDHLHYRHLLVVLVRCPAGPTESTMLKVVLAANSSRCREGPRISLNNGLSRTKESRAWPGMPDSHPSRRPSAMRV